MNVTTLRYLVALVNLPLGSPKGSNKIQKSVCGPKGLHRVVGQGKSAVFMRHAVDSPRVGPYRNVLKERNMEVEGKSLNNTKPLPPMPTLSPSEPPPPVKADTKAVMQPAFKRIKDLNRETYKARWHVSKAAAALTLLTNP